MTSLCLKFGLLLLPSRQRRKGTGSRVTGEVELLRGSSRLLLATWSKLAKCLDTTLVAIASVLTGDLVEVGSGAGLEGAFREGWKRHPAFKWALKKLCGR